MEIEVDPGKRRAFFREFSLKHLPEFRTQKKFGLFERENSSRKHNAPEHMLVVATRVLTLANMVGLGPETTNTLVKGALLHDAYKAIERTLTQPLRFSWESFEIAGRAETDSLREIGINPELIDMAQAGGHPINNMQTILEKGDPELTEADKAKLILYFVDMATSGTDWAVTDPISTRLNRDRTKYTRFQKSAVGKINGHPDEGGFDAMERTGKEAEKRLAHMFSRQIGHNIDPDKLLLLVDKNIQQQINTE